MPKRLIHEGRAFHLTPIRLNEADVAERPKAYPDGKCGPECHGGHPISGENPELEGVNYSWNLGWPYSGSKNDGVIQDQEPSGYLAWSKGRDGDGSDSDPGDIGFVTLVVEVTEPWLRRLMRGLDNWGPDVPKPAKVSIDVGPLSWRDLNELAKSARQSRDDAHGKPE